MDENKYIPDDHEKLSPDLEGLRKRQEETFRVPDGYFDRMPMEMQEHVLSRAKKKRTLWPQPIGIRQLVPVLAVLLVVIGVSIYFFTRIDPPHIVAVQPGEQSQAVEQPIDQDVLLEELDEDFLMDAIAMVEPAKKSDKPKTEAATEQQTKEEIEDYILDNFDETFLTDEL
jgi:hypothetical protein